MNCLTRLKVNKNTWKNCTAQMYYRYVFDASFSISANVNFINKIWGVLWYNEKSTMTHIDNKQERVYKHTP